MRVAINGGYGTNPSEVAPQIWTAFNLMNRATVAALAVGLLAVAVAVHPRLDDARRRLWATAGAGLLAASIGTITAAVVTVGNRVDEVEDWRIAHTERQRRTGA